MPGLSGYELTEELHRQLTEMASVLREGLRDRLELVNLADVDADPRVLEPLVGMPPFASADLLDSSSDRHADLDIVALQATRHLVQTKRVGSRGSEPFARRYWINVQPYATFLSIGVGRTDRSDEPRLWCWLAVHKVTPHCDQAVAALEDVFPGQVVPTPQGWAVPLAIPDGASAVEAFEAVVSQVERARARIREVLAAQ
ncbi:MAG: hypothetical protein PHU75_09905 [Candidatus Nanopelagicales bacterium]|nr:hypothetical protein [Candidatus Nanopelagicales bacterium]